MRSAASTGTSSLPMLVVVQGPRPPPLLENVRFFFLRFLRQEASVAAVELRNSLLLLFCVSLSRVVLLSSQWPI
jgi:hypothetical protein